MAARLPPPLGCGVLDGPLEAGHDNGEICVSQASTQTMEFARTFAGSWSAAILGGRFRGYLEILAVGSGVRVFSLASQFVVLIILSRILSKDSFGDIMTAFGFYRLGAIALGVGPSLVLLFHISRRPDDRDAEIRLHRYSAILAAAAAALVALIGVLAAEPIARAFGKPGLALWFVQLAPFAIFSTLLTVSTGALEGRSRVSESIMMGEGAPNAVRILLLPLVALASLPDSYVAHVLTLSVLAPWLWSARRVWDRSVAGLQPWKPWDYSYCGKFVVATLSPTSSARSTSWWRARCSPPRRSPTTRSRRASPRCSRFLRWRCSSASLRVPAS